jgi:hypothetical protein
VVATSNLTDSMVCKVGGSVLLVHVVLTRWSPSVCGAGHILGRSGIPSRQNRIPAVLRRRWTCPSSLPRATSTRIVMMVDPPL